MAEVMSSSEMRSKSSNWTLACDVELRKRLEITAKRFQDKAQAITEAIDDLNSKAVKTSGKLGNVTNRLLFLSNVQFVENRVFEEDEILDAEDNKKEADIANKSDDFNCDIGLALSAGAEYVTKSFEAVQFDQSDSEDDDLVQELEPVYESKNAYHSRKLPHIIGTQAFLSEEFIGLGHSEEEKEGNLSESSVSEDEEDEIQKEPLAEIVEPIEDSVSSSEDESDDVDDDVKPTEKKTLPIKLNFPPELGESGDEDDGAHTSAENPPPKLDFASELAMKLNGAKHNLPSKVATKKPEVEEMEDDATYLVKNSTGAIPKVKPVAMTKKSLFDSDSDDDDLFSGNPKMSSTSSVAAENPTKGQSVLFDDSSSEDEVEQKPQKKMAALVLPNPKTLFEDSSEDEMDSLFSQEQKKHAILLPPPKKEEDEEERTLSLFEQDEDDDPVQRKVASIALEGHQTALPSSKEGEDDLDSGGGNFLSKRAKKFIEKTFKAKNTEDLGNEAELGYNSPRSRQSSGRIKAEPGTLRDSESPSLEPGRKKVNSLEYFDDQSINTTPIKTEPIRKKVAGQFIEAADESSLIFQPGDIPEKSLSFNSEPNVHSQGKATVSNFQNTVQDVKEAKTSKPQLQISDSSATVDEPNSPKLLVSVAKNRAMRGPKRRPPTKTKLKEMKRIITEDFPDAVSSSDTEESLQQQQQQKQPMLINELKLRMQSTTARLATQEAIIEVPHDSKSSGGSAQVTTINDEKTDTIEKGETSKKATETSVVALFASDEDDDDLFAPPPMPDEIKPSKAKMTFFDDDSSDEDLFSSQVPREASKKSHLFSDSDEEEEEDLFFANK